MHVAWDGQSNRDSRSSKGAFDIDDINHVIDKNKERYMADLFELIRQPSISAQKVGVRDCAALLARLMKEAGIESRIMETPGQPIVFGEVGDPNPRYTVLVYGHYDVQPPDPLDKWVTPPFEPTIKDGRIYGRGAADNKGQFFTHVKGIQSYLQARGSLPQGVKFKYIFDGEEEVGSPNLAWFAEQHKDMLRSNLAILSGNHIHESGKPTLILGLKGMVYVDLTVRSLARDMHSMEAAALPSAAWRLVTLLSSIKGEDGTVKIPGFYDDVRPLIQAESDAVEAIPYDPRAIMAEYQAANLLNGRVTDHYYYNMSFEPTANICGITTGYGGLGAQTVLPAEARAKMDFRLVPDQDPDDIVAKLRQHLDSLGYSDVEMAMQHSIRPSRTPIDSPWTKVACRALERIHGVSPIIYPSMGGSGPNYVFSEVLGIPFMILPFGPHDQANHAPNESMTVDGYYNGIKTAAAIIEEIGNLP